MQVLTYVYCYPLPEDAMSLVFAAARRRVPRVRADTAQFLAPISGFHVGNRRSIHGENAWRRGGSRTPAVKVV